MNEDWSKTELVRRARNLNQQAIGYRLSGVSAQKLWAKEMCSRRDEFMRRARAI